jgi:hypothetical protein
MRNSRPVIAALLVSTLLLLWSCNRSESDDEAPAEVSEPETAVESNEPGAPAGARAETLPADTVPMRLTDQGRARREQPVVSPADPRDTAFESGRFAAVVFHPMDTVLGALGGPGGSARERAILAACQSLLTPLLSGELPIVQLSGTVGPGGRAVLDDLIWASSSFSQVRLGLVHTLTDREVAVPFRMIGETRSAVGEVILERGDDRWYTADVQVEISDRDTTSRFDPGAIRSGQTM